MEISGSFSYPIHRDIKSGYAVFDMKSDSGSDIICAGIIPPFARYMPIILEGEWKEKDGKKRFLFTSFREGSKYRRNAISFLMNSGFAGIGPTIAERIVDNLGVSLFEFSDEPGAEERLIKAIGRCPGRSAENMASELLSFLRRTNAQRKVMLFLTKYGLGYHTMSAITEKYGEASLDCLEKDPYATGFKCKMPFSVCDRIWLDMGGGRYSPQRMSAAVTEALKRSESDGNTFETLQHLMKRCIRILSEDSEEADVPDVCILDAILSSKSIVRTSVNGKTILALTDTDTMEKNIVMQARRLCDDKVSFPLTDDVISEAEKKAGVSLGTDQVKAMQSVASSGVFFVQGKPGAGKTTMVRSIVAAYHLMFPYGKVMLGAPTGRAARRLRESTGHDAETIHRLLDIRPYGETYTFCGPSDPLQCGLIIIDEATMVDNALMSMLLSSLRSGVCAIFVGDVNQLPSVGAGNVFSDMIASGCFPVYTLEKVYRQSDGSSIIENAGRIASGVTELKEDDSFRIIRVDSYQEALARVQLILSAETQDEMRSTQVLTTVKNAEGVGVRDLNKVIQKMQNLGAGEAIYGFYTFHEGDRVMLTDNNYKVGYVNGDIGIISRISDGIVSVDMSGYSVDIPEDCMSDMVPAYAVSIHKSQGSEWDTVITAPSGQTKVNAYKKPNRDGAATRARKREIIISVDGALERAITNNSVMRRNTMLRERLLEAFR